MTTPAPASPQKVLSNESGFSILEVVVALGLMTVLLYHSAQQTLSQTRIVAGADLRTQIADVKTSVMIALMPSEVCFQNFSGQVLGDLPNTNLQKGYRDYASDPSGPWKWEVLYAFGSQYKIRNSFYIEKARLDGVLAPGNTGMIELTLSIIQTRETVGPVQLERSIPIRATLDADGKITSCQAHSGLADFKPILCENPGVSCTDSGNYCNGEIFPNTAEDCLCVGSKTSGTNPNGMTCNPPAGP